MRKLEDTEKVNPLYRGIDYLRIGYFVEAENPEDYNLFVDNLRDYLQLPYEEQYFEIPATLWNGIEIEPQKVRVKTTAHIYPYVIILYNEDLNISIRLGHSLKPYQVEELYQGYTKTPNILIEISGQPLRPTRLLSTQLFLKAFFSFLIEHFGIILHAFTFSRIDYALDFWDKETAIDLLLSFETARKIKITSDEKKSILKKSVKALREEILQIANSQNVKHIGVGSPETRLIVYYLKSDADPHLQSIYSYLNFPYGDLYPHRLEIRFNNKFFKTNRRLYFLDNPDEAWNINSLIELSYNEIEPHLTEKVKTYTQTHHPLIDGATQNPPAENTAKELNKKVKKLKLRDRALRFLTLVLGGLKENIEPEEIIRYAKLLTQREDRKVMERLKRFEISQEKLFTSLSAICNANEIL